MGVKIKRVELNKICRQYWSVLYYYWVYT